MSSDFAPKDAQAAVLVQSEPVPDSAISVEGPNFDKSLGLQDLLNSYERIGFQATSLGRAIDIVNRMVSNHRPTSGSMEFLSIYTRAFTSGVGVSQMILCLKMSQNCTAIQMYGRILGARSSLGLLRT